MKNVSQNIICIKKREIFFNSEELTPKFSKQIFNHFSLKLNFQKLYKNDQKSKVQLKELPPLERKRQEKSTVSENISNG